jgi:hypothetical protein
VFVELGTNLLVRALFLLAGEDGVPSAIIVSPLLQL